MTRYKYIDPELVAVAKDFPKIKYTRENLEQIRQNPIETPGQMYPVEGVLTEERRIDGPDEGQDLRVRIYQLSERSNNLPGLLWMHGGGYITRSGENVDKRCQEWTKSMNCVTVSVDYRLAPEHPFPAAVEDCRCALRWIYRNAEQFNFDLNQIVVTGNSAGGHLSLTTGMLPESADMDRQCPGNRRRAWSTGETSTEELKVAAIINWYGITDVADSLHRKPGPSGAYTVAWLGSSSDREDIAQKVSPLTYVRGGLPPTLTIHGDADETIRTLHGSGARGLNRVNWDLRHESPLPPTGQGGFGGPPAGPRALPGTYSVRITAGDSQSTTTVTVFDDPRINVPQADRRAQRDALLGLGGLMARLDGAHQTAERFTGQLELLAESLESGEVPAAVSSMVVSVSDQMDALEGKLARGGGFGGASPRPLSSRITRLYRNLESYTERPNAFQVTRIEAYTQEFNGLLEELDQFIASEIATLNSTIEQHGIQRITH